MRLRSRTALRAVLPTLLATAAGGACATPALAAPADVHVRVEGVASTIVDRVVRSVGGTVQAASDPTPRTCDGTNHGANPAPGPTATGATVDALRSIGQTFDGTWYPGYDDYFLTRWGTEAEQPANGWWWGLLLDWAVAPVGGCQHRVRSGDEVLWVNDVFSGRPFLLLDGAAKAVVGEPYTARVTSTTETTGGAPVGEAHAGAVVGGVDANGHPAAAAVVESGPSASDGTAIVTFTALGWQRIKARMPDSDADGREDAIASNSLDVCVVASPTDGCAGSPPSQLPPGTDPEPDPGRDPEPDLGADPGTGPGGAPGTDPGGGDGSDPGRLPQPAPAPTPLPPTGPQAAATSDAPVRLQLPRIDRAGASSGRVRLTWRVRDAGAGVASWRVEAKPLGVRRARFVQRATGGAGATAAALRLPAGRTYALRFTLVDVLGRTSSAAVGRALVPLDDRARAIRRSGAWRAVRDAGAWKRTVSRGRRGATLRVRLRAGRPAFVVRPAARPARVELRSAAGRRVVRIPARGGTRELRAAARRRGGPVTLRVLSGTVNVDGVGLAP